MPTIEGNLCPTCDSPLSSHPDASPGHPPWCGACEWNLDRFTDDSRLSWFARRMVRADRRAGFASHRRLARSAEPSPVGAGVFAFLVLVSAAVMLIMVAAFAAGLWLIIAGGLLWPVVLGALLLALAAVLRPRFVRLKRLLTSSYRVEPADAPTLHVLIDRIAGRLDAPRPDALLLDFSWNASVTLVGPRPRRVLRLGVPLLLALDPQELVALVGHEMGHLKHADNRRAFLTAPARTAFGRLSEAIRPPSRSADELNLPGYAAVLLMAWQLVGGLTSLMLYATHLGVNVVAAGDDRSVELRADAMAAEAAGTAATLRMLDLLATLPSLTGYVQHYVDKGQAGATWRRVLRSVRDREAATAPAWRQLSIRTDASLLTTHPAPGRRHQWVAARPARGATVHLTEGEVEALAKEIRPYAEALHRTMLKAHPSDD